MENTNEKWRQISDNPIYQISNLGNFRRVRWVGDVPRMRKLCLDKSGYPVVSLRNPSGKLLLRKIHRLVAFAFIGDTGAKCEVNHKDGVKTNNRVENLEWVTTAENDAHARKLGLKVPIRGERHGNTVFDEQAVRDIHTMRLAGEPIKKIADYYEVASATITRILHGQRWQHVQGLPKQNKRRIVSDEVKLQAIEMYRRITNFHDVGRRLGITPGYVRQLVIGIRGARLKRRVPQIDGNCA